ncbi:MAG: phenylacetate--CoA ligase family protein [Gemmataceae bacterium]
MALLDGIHRRLIHPLWARREDRFAGRLANELRRRQFDPPKVIAARQLSALRRILRHAVGTVPYYRDLFHRLRLSPEDVASFDELQRLPLLTKSDVRERGDEMMSEAFLGRGHAPSRCGLLRKTTSGSTGVPLAIRLDASGLSWKRACTLRSDEWSGWRRGEAVAKVWGNPDYRRHGIKGWLRNSVYERAIHLDTLRMSPGEIRDFAMRLCRDRPSLIFGHAHSLFLVADTIEREQLPRHRPNGIIATAMVLHDFQRRRIEAVFGCSVTNRYGCEEVSLIACECERHRGMHINADSVLVETVADGRQVYGTPGGIVVTDLSNFAMPLIRYQIGDVGILSRRSCECGRGLPVLESLEGREADFVVTASGDLVSGISLTENFAVLVPGIAQLQIVQEELRSFAFRIVRSPDFNAASTRKIADLVVERFGRGIRHRLEFIEAIPQEPSGKYRFCISHVTRPTLAEGERAAA